MKKILSLILSIIFIFSAIGFSGCAGKKVLILHAFGTPIRVQSNDDKSFSLDVEEQLTELFSSLDNEFSTNIKTSTVYAFNSANAGEEIIVSDTFKEVFSIATELYQFTNGAFNPSIMPLVELWQFSNHPVINFKPPTQAQINDTLAKCNFSTVSLSNNALCKTDSAVKLDFGGILKGYAVDLALALLRDKGFENGYISIGSSSLGLMHCDSLAINHPRQKEQTIVNVNCKDKRFTTLSTSGDYEKYYLYDGVRYSHIIDAKTGLTVQTGVASATLIGVSGAVSDALTTALCTATHTPNDMQSSELVKLLNKITTTYPSTEFYVVYDKDNTKQLITNKKQGEDFTLLDTDYTVVQI